MDVLADKAADTFEDEMAAHLNRCFPEQSKAMQETGVRETIRYGVEQARQHGITAQRDVCKYIDLMVVYGRDFDRDPGVPWAAPILNDRALKDATLKMDALYEAGKEHQTGVKSDG